MCILASFRLSYEIKIAASRTRWSTSTDGNIGDCEKFNPFWAKEKSCEHLLVSWTKSTPSLSSGIVELANRRARVNESPCYLPRERRLSRVLAYFARRIVPKENERLLVIYWVSFFVHKRENTWNNASLTTGYFECWGQESMLTTILCPSTVSAWRVSITILGILLSAAMNRCRVPC